MLSRLVLLPESEQTIVLGSESTLTGHRLSTVGLSLSDGSVASSARSHGSIESPTSFVVAGSQAVWIDRTTISTLDLQRPDAVPIRVTSSFVKVQDVSLERQGYFLAFKGDGTAELLTTDGDNGVIPVYAFEPVSRLQT